jgi:ABC-2 type transport system permease protein
MSAFWMVFAILGLQIFFYHRNQIGEWGYYEAMLVVGFFALFNGFIEALLMPNISRVVEQIRLGTFDFVLLKPVNSQFLATLRYLSVWKLADVLLGLGICTFAVTHLKAAPSLAGILLSVLLLLSGAVIDNITELFMAIYETGRFPVSVYPGWLRGVLTFVIPIAFVTTFPAAAVLSIMEKELVLMSLVLATVLFTVSSWFWHFAVKHYSSASS